MKFLCIDNNPFVESVNKVAALLGASNIEFRRQSLRDGRMGGFDYVYLMAVIYCVPNDCLRSFFISLGENMNKRGRILVGAAANISMLRKLIGNVFPHRMDRRAGWKQIGWMRDYSELKKHIPDDFRVLEIHPCYHKTEIPSVIRHRMPWLAEVIAWFSKNVYPISNSKYLIEMEKSI